jgi:hypothetical protein
MTFPYAGQTQGQMMGVEESLLATSRCWFKERRYEVGNPASD